MFASLLKDSKLMKDVTWEDVRTIASTSCNTNNLLQQEFLGMLEKAQKIYPQRKKK
jgi:hypothetical protein